jgi:threonine/homoserine/homoserine lactone efflux protein
LTGSGGSGDDGSKPSPEALMPSPETLLTFLGLSLLVTLAPGPDNLMVLGQSLARGRRAGLGLALGCALGCYTHTLWATLGVSAALAASPALFGAMKAAGAAWLGYLGWQTLRAPGTALFPTAPAQPPRPWRRDVLRGFLANALNPKVALFFLAFLPQFARPEAGRMALQMGILGTVFVAQTILVFGAIAITAGSLGRWLARRPGLAPWLERLAGAVFVALALRLVLAEGPGPVPSPSR